MKLNCLRCPRLLVHVASSVAYQSTAYQTSLWAYYDTSQKRPTSSFPPSFSVSHKHTHLNKQRDTGLSCSIVVSGKLCAPVEALADCFWIEYGSRPIPWSSVPQSATCLIMLSISLWDEEQTICSSWQIAHLKWLDIGAHSFPALLIKVKGDIPFMLGLQIKEKDANISWNFKSELWWKTDDDAWHLKNRTWQRRAVEVLEC